MNRIPISPQPYKCTGGARRKRDGKHAGGLPYDLKSRLIVNPTRRAGPSANTRLRVQTLNWNEGGAGDYEGGQFRLRFDTNGTILPGKGGKGRGDDNDYFAKHLAVYYAHGVFLIRHRTNPNAGKGGLAPIFMLDYPNRDVTISAPARRPFWQLFPDEKLKG